jgi:aspartyl-tRNA(Asn)/glutamyl-tRNA(Gln) amidotransferase subunit A
MSLNNIPHLQNALRSGSMTSLEIVSHYLEKIKLLNPQVHAFIEVYADEALEQARVLDAQRQSGLLLSPLHGIPIALKDLIDIKGRETTAGSTFNQKIATESAPLVDLLKKAGLIIIGKTHTVQFALGAWGTNEFMGTPKNPWDLDKHLTPGGSSSGSAVAVASGMVPLSLGTDTGGSIRVPAAFCSLYGMKTTVQRISTQGVAPLSNSLDTVGMFAKGSEALMDLFQILCGTGVSAHAFNDPHPSPSYPLGLLRLGRLHPEDLKGVDEDIVSAYGDFIARLVEHGARVETIKMPFTFERVAVVSSAIMMAEAALEYGEFALDPSKAVDSSVRPRLLAGLQLSAKDYVQALRDQAHMKQTFNASIEHLDAFLTPSTLCAPVLINEVNHDRPPVRYTRLLNLLDMCGMSIPVGFDKKGLPIGLQLAGRTAEDELVMQMTRSIQETLGLANPYPHSMSFY